MSFTEIARTVTLGVLFCIGCTLDTYGISEGRTASALTTGDTATAEGSTEPGVTGVETAGADTSTATTTTTNDEGSSGSSEPSTTLGSEGKACDPWAQDCGEGLKCVPYASDGSGVWDANKCTTVGVGGPGAPCIALGGANSGYDTCGAGLICWEVDNDTLQGVCSVLCNGSPVAPICPPGSGCSMTNKGVNVCLQDCNPLADMCPEGKVCVPDADEQFLCLVAGGTVDVGQFCKFVNECTPGSSCIDSAYAALCEQQSPFCCLPFCSLKDPVCPEGLACVPYFAEGTAPPEHAELGLCQDPA